MGDIDPYETKKGRRYRVRYRKPDKSSTDKRGFKTRKEAELFLASITMSKATGDYIDPAAGRATIEHLGPLWLEKKSTAKPSYYRSLEIAWRVYVLPKWGRYPVSGIESAAVEAWISQLIKGTAPRDRQRGNAKTVPAAEPLSASSVMRAVGVLAGILDDAVRAGRIKKNPARGADNLPKKETTKVRRYLDDDEVMRLAEAIADPVRSTLVLVLAYTGLRWSEAIGLRVRDVNPLRRRLQVRRPLVELDGIFHEGEPKSWERRSVPYPAFLALAIAHLCEGRKLDERIFVDEGGHSIRQPHVESSWFLGGLRDAGIERLTPHDLRHTAASLAISSGANVKVVQLMLGHKSAAMTLDVYADLFPDDLETVAERLDARATAATDVGKMWARVGIGTT
ncbi:site-specific integrase [Microbacterium trichothecenolyticum]|uniref:site-specific integrase n=1 Tax=Microbacterium trichothecenolyticum TaxID=69370 RepID=UPI001C6E7F16|nr:site-specific integrase [Microbacterium trichothecenolyticum]MBW9118854.1 site-specific integrase [Microbacterium trichothecenolyticum]